MKKSFTFIALLLCLFMPLMGADEDKEEGGKDNGEQMETLGRLTGWIILIALIGGGAWISKWSRKKKQS